MVWHSASSHLSCLLITVCYLTSLLCNWAGGNTDCAETDSWMARASPRPIQSLWRGDKNQVWEKSTNDTQQVNIISLFFFHLFHIFSYNKSVSNWHQSEVWEKKKKNATSAQTTFKCTIPLSSRPSSSSSGCHSFIGLILSIHPQKNAVLNLFFFF